MRDTSTVDVEISQLWNGVAHDSIKETKCVTLIPSSDKFANSDII
jgi:hypothetical protein